jgi:hypothetical protein
MGMLQLPCPAPVSRLEPVPCNRSHVFAATRLQFIPATVADTLVPSGLPPIDKD